MDFLSAIVICGVGAGVLPPKAASNLGKTGHMLFLHISYLLTTFPKSHCLWNISLFLVWFHCPRWQIPNQKYFLEKIIRF